MGNFKMKGLQISQFMRSPSRFRFLLSILGMTLITLLASTIVATAAFNPTSEPNPATFPSLQDLPDLPSITGETIANLIPDGQREVLYKVETAGAVNFALTDLTRDFDLQLLDSGYIEYDRSDNAGTQNESITLDGLPVDTYILRIYKPDDILTTGGFKLRASNNVPNDLIVRENGFPQVPTLQNSLTFSGGVSGRDTSDVYRFTFPNNGNLPATAGFRVDLSGLNSGAAVEVRLIREINSPGSRANIIESDDVSQVLDSKTASQIEQRSAVRGGNYVIQVNSRKDGSSDSKPRATRYKLTITRI